MAPGIGWLLLLVLHGVRGAPAQSPPDSLCRAVAERGDCPIDPETAPRPETYAVRIHSAVRVDGLLDEPAWEQARAITSFIQSKPNPGYPASEETVVRILYDDEKLYVGAILYESQPEKITANSLKREYPSGEEDTFGVVLDTFLDRRNGFMWGVNPNGALRDGQVTDDGREINFAWEGLVERAARLDGRGWTVELAIPFSTLRFDPKKDEQVWGLNFIRRIKRKNEDAFWAPLDRRFGLNRVSRGGTLRGLRGIRSGLNLTVKPYILGAVSNGVEGPPTQWSEKADGGVDAKYGVTRQLTLDLTFRTDFSQVEVDEVQLNLTRFSPFFPEKREFFIENSGFFDFGDAREPGYRLGAAPEDFKLFYSRRIGLHQGRPVPVLGGGRLTGRVAEFEVGILNMQTEAAHDLSAENFNAARLRRTLFGNVQVGALFLSRQTTDETAGSSYNRSFGGDLNVRLFRNLMIHSYLAGTWDGVSERTNRAGRLSAGWRDRLWDASAMYREIGDAFNPQLGFVSRRGMRQRYATVGMHPRPGLPFIIEVNPYLSLDYVTNLASVLESRTATLGFDVDLTDGGGLELWYKDRFERLTEPFQVLSQGEVAPGAYDFAEASIQYRSTRGRALSSRVRLGVGGFYDGSKRTVELGGLWKTGSHFSVEVTAQHNAIDLATGSLNADVLAGRFEYAFSTRLFGNAFTQYNSSTGEWVTNARMNWIHSPLSDLFLVYTERRNLRLGEVVERQIAAKLTKSISL